MESRRGAGGSAFFLGSGLGGGAGWFHSLNGPTHPDVGAFTGGGSSSAASTAPAPSPSAKPVARAHAIRLRMVVSPIRIGVARAVAAALWSAAYFLMRRRCYARIAQVCPVEITSQKEGTRSRQILQT